MRKLFWGSAALAVATATSVYFTADYAARNPQSLVGRCACVADHVGRVLNPFSVFSEMAARQAAAIRQRVVAATGEDGCVMGGAPQPETNTQEQPAEPSEAVEPVEIIQVEAGQGAIDPTALAEEAFGLRLPKLGAHGVEDEACEAEPDQGTVEETQEPVRYGIVPAEDEQPEPGQNSSDTAQEQDTDLVMPYSEDENDTQDGGGFCSWFRALVQFGVEDAAQTDEDQGSTGTTTEEEQGEQGQTNSTQDGAGTDSNGNSEEGQDEAQPQSSYHHQYESCPYLHGCPYPYSSSNYYPNYYPAASQPAYIPSQPATSPAEGEGDTAKPARVKKAQKHKKAAQSRQDASPAEASEESPAHSDLDTLEYRPSDGDPNAFTNMWF